MRLASGAGRVVVLGATGFVGSHLVEKLRREGIGVRCTYRREVHGAAFSGLGMETARADVRDVSSLREAFRGAAAVVNLATTTRERRKGEFQEVFHGGMRNLVEAARAEGVQRIVHLGALADPAARGDSSRPYLYWKQKGTEILQASDLDFTILETSIVFGPGDQHLSVLALALGYLPFVPIAGRAVSRTRLQPVWVGDVVQCVIGALELERSAGRTFPLAGPDVWTVRDLFRTVGELLGRPRRPVVVPRWSVKAASAALGAVLRHHPLPPALIDVMEVDSFGDSRATYEHFGITPARLADRFQYLRSVGLRDLRRWIRGAPHVHPAERAGP
ncbi:MAG: NAD(P)H-binding protein [Planctomycetes bacterium]|nr:NAD(P)H-binding protein [Planctomycetota bacterium]